MDSILDTKKGQCFVCGRICQTHKHHIFGGANRRLSEEDGLYIYLCPQHHNMGNWCVHNDIRMNRWIQQEGQMAYESTHSREDFMRRYGRNYIEEDT